MGISIKSDKSREIPNTMMKLNCRKIEQFRTMLSSTIHLSIDMDNNIKISECECFLLLIFIHMSIRE